jgi:hypothetical protein
MLSMETSIVLLDLLCDQSLTRLACGVQDSPPEPSNNKVYIEHSDEFEAYVATYGALSATQPAKWQFGLCNQQSRHAGHAVW